jgi:hypothetical protein
VLVLWKLRCGYWSYNKKQVGFFPLPWYETKFLFNVQEGVAIEIAEAVVGALKGELASTAVNAPMVPAEVLLQT